MCFSCWTRLDFTETFNHDLRPHISQKGISLFFFLPRRCLSYRLSAHWKPLDCSLSSWQSVSSLEFSIVFLVFPSESWVIRSRREINCHVIFLFTINFFFTFVHFLLTPIRHDKGTGCVWRVERGDEEKFQKTLEGLCGNKLNCFNYSWTSPATVFSRLGAALGKLFRVDFALEILSLSSCENPSNSNPWTSSSTVFLGI